MPKQHVMDRVLGHATHEFDAKDTMSTKEAMERFAELTGKGYVAAKKLDDGAHEVIGEFDPSAEETLFFPQLQGG